MQQTTLEPGVYIDRATCRILRVADGNEAEGRDGNWELLVNDPDMGLLGAREAAVSKGFTDDGTTIDWYRFEENEIVDMDVMDDLNKAKAKADATAEAEDNRTGTLLVN